MAGCDHLFASDISRERLCARPARSGARQWLRRCREWMLSSDSVVGQRMAISFTVELHDGLMDRVIEVFGAREGLVSELVSLQVAPELFDVVELRSVFGQPLDPEPVGTFGKSRLACLA